MKITILYFEGCPNHPPVAEMSRRVVVERGLNAAVEEVEVAPDEVVQRRFLGSPTVQVDGMDIEPAARERTDFAMSCRVYNTPDGVPSEEMLLAALGVNAATVAPATKDRVGFLAIGGSVVTAILSSACCWIPLLLLTFGASAAGASVFFERWRPVFIAFALIMLALGFYFSYFRKTVCTDRCCGERPRRGRRLQRATLWGSAVVVAAFIFFPNYVGLLLNGSDSAFAVSAADILEADTREYVFTVDGMHCEACAVTLRNELVKLDGVSKVQVDYDTKTARVHAIGDGIPARVVEVASRVGYTAIPRAEE